MKAAIEKVKAKYVPVDDGGDASVKNTAHDAEIAARRDRVAANVKKMTDAYLAVGGGDAKKTELILDAKRSAKAAGFGGAPGDGGGGGGAMDYAISMKQNLTDALAAIARLKAQVASLERGTADGGGGCAAELAASTEKLAKMTADDHALRTHVKTLDAVSESKRAILRKAMDAENAFDKRKIATLQSDLASSRAETTSKVDELRELRKRALGVREKLKTYESGESALKNSLCDDATREANENLRTCESRLDTLRQAAKGFIDATPHHLDSDGGAGAGGPPPTTTTPIPYTATDATATDATETDAQPEADQTEEDATAW